MFNYFFNRRALLLFIVCVSHGGIFTTFCLHAVLLCFINILFSSFLLPNPKRGHYCACVCACCAVAHHTMAAVVVAVSVCR